jgi:aminopeptidase N
MTNSENINNFGANAYGKPATALNILRETVMGRELFDYAFKQYAQRWEFKHPTPSDFFRTMEDASGVDLDWYWRAWFYDIDPVDISLDSVSLIRVNNTKEIPEKMVTTKRRDIPVEFEFISKIRNKQSGMTFLVDVDTTLRDFYFYNKAKTADFPLETTKNVNERLTLLTPEESKVLENNYYYELNFSNKGGCVMPVIIQWNYTDGTNEIDQISAYIWRKNETNFTKTFAKNKEVKSIVIDPYRETADIDEFNNTWPITIATSRFDIYKTKKVGRGENNDLNLMQKARGIK